MDGRHWPPLSSVHCPRLIICVALTPYPQYTAVNNVIVCTHWETPLLWLMLVLSYDMGVIILILFVICFVFTANFTRYNNFNFSNINAIFMLLPSLHYIFFLQKLFIMLTKFKTHPLILFLHEGREHILSATVRDTCQFSRWRAFPTGLFPMLQEADSSKNVIQCSHLVWHVSSN